MMELKLPRTLLHWIDSVRGEMSREAFIVHNMVNIMNKVKLAAQMADTKIPALKRGGVSFYLTK